MTTKDKEKQIQNLIRRTIIESVQNIFGDPDYSMDIKNNITDRLKKYSLKTPSKHISLKDIKKKYL